MVSNQGWSALVSEEVPAWARDRASVWLAAWTMRRSEVVLTISAFAEIATCERYVCESVTVTHDDERPHDKIRAAILRASSARDVAEGHAAWVRDMCRGTVCGALAHLDKQGSRP